MVFRSWSARWGKRKARSAAGTGSGVRSAALRRCIPHLEALEDRCVPSTSPTSGTALPQTLVGSFQGQPVTALTGEAFSGVVATFTANSATGLSSSVNWGDGHTTAGAILPADGAAFDIVGINAYSRPGSYSIVVTLTSSAGDTQAVSSTATVTNLSFTVTPSASGSTNFTTDGGARDASFADGIPVLGGVLVSLPSADGKLSAPEAAVPPPALRSGTILSANFGWGYVSLTVSSTEQVPWSNLREQQPNPAAPATVPARRVSLPTEVPVLLVLLEAPNGAPQAVAAAPEPGPAPAVGNTGENPVELTTAAEPHGAAQPVPAESAAAGVSGPEPAPDTGPAVVYRPLYQVADRSELSGLPGGLPYRLSAEPAGAVPPLAPARGRPGAGEAVVLGSAAPKAAHEDPEKGGLRLAGPLRPGLLAATASILQALYLSVFRAVSGVGDSKASAPEGKRDRTRTSLPSGAHAPGSPR